jgi:hypothetical protein
MQGSCKVLKYYFDYFIYNISLVFPLLINEVDQIFAVSCPYNMQRQLCFKSLFVFSPWLAGRFYNFELTQNRKKQEMVLFVSVESNLRTRTYDLQIITRHKNLSICQLEFKGFHRYILVFVFSLMFHAEVRHYNRVLFLPKTLSTSPGS